MSVGFASGRDVLDDSDPRLFASDGDLSTNSWPLSSISNPGGAVTVKAAVYCFGNP